MHVTNLSYTGCAGFPDQNWSCENILTIGVDLPFYWAWVLIGDVPSSDGPGMPGGVNSVQFGIEYDPGITGLAWSLCEGATETPQDDGNGTWPASGTGNLVTFDGGCFGWGGQSPDNPDGLTKIGAFVLESTDTGIFHLTADSRLGEARLLDCSLTPFVVCEELLGSVNAEAGGDPEPQVCGGGCDVPVLERTWAGVKAAYR